MTLTKAKSISAAVAHFYKDFKLGIIYVVGGYTFACNVSTDFSMKKTIMQIVNRKVFYANLPHVLYALMRILWFNWRDLRNSEAGGAEVYTHEVMKGLARRGHEMIVFT
jgi:hypothetical protein